MSELPRKAAAVLALAKRAHDPDEATVIRVRERVAQAVASDASAAKDHLPSSGASKKIALPRALIGTLVSVGATVLVGSGLLLSRPDKAPEASRPRRSEQGQLPSPAAPEVGVAAPIELLPREAEPRVPAEAGEARTKIPPRVSRLVQEKNKPLASEDSAPAPPPDSLAAEVRLLESSSAALNRNDPQRALQILQRYRDTFDRPILQREHDGLRVLARCTLGDQAAVSEAKDLLANDPSSVLRGKIIRVCKLTAGEL